MLQRSLRRGAVAAMVLAAAGGIAACGGSSKPTVNASPLLSQTLSANTAALHSGNLSLSLSANLQGLAALQGEPASLQLSGPFVITAGPGGAVVAKFNFSATANYAGAAIPLSIVSTGKALYVEFGGTYYALPASMTRPLLSSTVVSGASSTTSLLARLGIDPRSWLTNAQLVGSATVGGVATTHLTAKVDVAKMLSDVGTLLSRMSSLLGASRASSPTASELSQLASVITSARVDVYTGTSDHVIREFRFAVDVTVPPADRSAVDGLTGGSVTLDLTISNLNTQQSIVTPSSSEPLSDLLGSSGPLSALGG